MTTNHAKGNEGETVDMVQQARQILNASNAYAIRINVRELLDALANEVEAMRRGEFICSRCHLRKDTEHDQEVTF